MSQTRSRLNLPRSVFAAKLAPGMRHRTGMESISTTCVIAGGGPAGMMAGYLFARAGLDVVVLEKHADFLRDFRGDTVHPSTIQVIHELGLLEAFLAANDRPRIRIRIAEMLAEREWPVKGFRPKIEETLPEGFHLTAKGLVRRK